MFLYLCLYCVLLLFMEKFIEAYVAMLYMNYPRCGDCADCAFSGSFVKESTDVSNFAGEDVGLTGHKESVVAQEIKEVELISRRAQFIYDRNYDRNADFLMHLTDFRCRS